MNHVKFWVAVPFIAVGFLIYCFVLFILDCEQEVHDDR